MIICLIAMPKPFPKLSLSWNWTMWLPCGYLSNLSSSSANMWRGHVKFWTCPITIHVLIQFQKLLSIFLASFILSIDKRPPFLVLLLYPQGSRYTVKNCNGFNENLPYLTRCEQKKQGKDLCFQGVDFLLVRWLPGRQVASATRTGWSCLSI